MEEIDVKLLLHHPEEHARVDEKLLTLLQMLHGSQPYETCAGKARKIIESVTWNQGGKDYQDGKGYLIRPTWETDRFKGNRCVMTAWFDGRECGNEIADALHAAITEMVRFILDAKTPYAQQECRNQLIKTLSLYLEMRGKDVTKHPDGPEGGRMLWWNGKSHKFPKGQRYDILAFMWGCDYAPFGEIIDYAFKGSVSNSTMTTAVNRVNDALRGIPDFPRKLATDCVNRFVSWKAKT